jgi:transcriptional regulator with XRE-family HTH domain
MKKVVKTSSNSLDSYIEDNRMKIDEALVSLRLMKEIDDFLDDNKISQRDFAGNIGCSEAYISQLMAGTKKFNTSFINKFEKNYKLKIDFKIKTKSEYAVVSKMANSHIEININLIEVIRAENIFSFENKPNEFSEMNSNFITI